MLYSGKSSETSIENFLLLNGFFREKCKVTPIGKLWTKEGLYETILGKIITVTKKKSFF